MKKTLLLVLLCTLFFAFPVSAAEIFANGFRGIPWGTKAPEAEGSGNKWDLYDVGRRLSEKRYERDGEELSFAGAEVVFIEYCFQDSLGFAKVQISFRGIENYKLIRKACFENWGQPYSEDIDKKFLGPKKLKDAKKDIGKLNYEYIYNSWKGKGIRVYLWHHNVGRGNGTMTVYLNDYYDKTKIDDAKYPQEKEAINSFMEEWGLK